MSIINKVLISSFQLTTATFIVRLISLLSFPILTRILGPESYGIAGLATTFISIFTIIGIAGQDSSYVKCYHDAISYDQKSVDIFYLRYSWYGGFLAGLLAAISWIIYVSYNIEYSYAPAIFIFIGVFGSVIASFRQARARLIGAYNSLVISVILSGLVSTLICIAISWYIFRNELGLLSAVCGYWISIYILRSKIPNRDAIGISTDKLKKMIKIGLPLLATAPAYWIISSSDRLFLAASVTPTELGIFSVAVTVGSLGQMVTSALCSVWYPELSKQLQSKNSIDYKQLATAQTIIIWILLCTFFFISLFSNEIITVLAGHKYKNAINYVPIIAVALFFYGVNQFQGFGFTMQNKNHIIPIIWTSASVISILLNYIFVPIYGCIASGLIQAFVYVYVSFVSWYVSRLYVPFQPYWGRIFTLSIIFSIVFLIDYIISQSLSMNFFVYAFIKFLITLVIYLYSFKLIFDKKIMDIFSVFAVK